MAWEQIVDKKMNQDFRGHAEEATFTFSLGPEQLPGTDWAAQYVVNSFVNELAKENSSLLELRVWEDTAPTWHTDYYVEIVATASPLWWNVIIAGALLVMIGVAIWFSLESVEDIVEYIGEKAPITLPLLAIAGIGLVGLAILVVARRRT